jgi:hypothetical protein
MMPIGRVSTIIGGWSVSSGGRSTERFSALSRGLDHGTCVSAVSKRFFPLQLKLSLLLFQT